MLLLYLFKPGECMLKFTSCFFIFYFFAFYSNFIFLRQLFYEALILKKKTDCVHDTHLSPFSNVTQENWEHLIKTYGSGFLITRFVSAVVSPVCFMALYMLCPIGFLSSTKLLLTISIDILHFFYI